MAKKRLEKVKYFVERHRKLVLYVLVAILIAIAAYAGYRYWETRDSRNLNSAFSLLEAGSYDEAEAKLLKLIKSDPENVSPYLLLAALKVEKLARSKNKQEDAREIVTLLDAIDKMKKSSESTRLRAMTEYILGKNYTARKYGMEALKLDNDNDKAWALLGLISEKELKWEMAEGYYNQSLKRSKNNVETMLGLARVLWQEGKTKAAKTKAGEAISTAQDRLAKAKAYYMMGHFNASEKDYKDAIGNFGRALNLSPNEFATRGELSNALYAAYNFNIEGFHNKNTVDQAIQHALFSVKLNPDYSYGYFFAAQAYRLSKQNDTAKRYFESALRVATKAKADKTFISKINKEIAALATKK